MPQVRRGQIGTNQAVVERERRFELNLGGRKGKERKVLGLGLGARISRRSMIILLSVAHGNKKPPHSKQRNIRRDMLYILAALLEEPSV